MLIEQIIELELRWHGPPGRTSTLTTSSELLFTAKIFHEVMNLSFTHLGPNHLQL